MTRREEFSVDDPAGVEVEARSGAVDIRQSSPGRIVVSIGGDAGDDWQVSRFGDTVSVRPGSRWRSRSAKVLVEVPPGTSVDVRTVSADVNLVGRLGACRIAATSGDVRVGSVSELAVSTASGNVRAETIATQMGVTAVSGDITAGSVAGRLTATTASGDVRVRHAGGDVIIGTTSGDVRIERFDGANLAVKCVSGDVELGLPGGIRVEPDISTLSGRTRLPLPAPVVPSAERDAARRVVRLQVRTVSGDVTIDRAG